MYDLELDSIGSELLLIIMGGMALAGIITVLVMAFNTKTWEDEKEKK